MKKKFIVGMMIVTSTLSFSAHAAGTAVEARPAREVLKTYVEDVKKWAAKKIGENRASLPVGEKMKTEKAAEIFMEELKVPAADKTSIKSAMGKSKNKKAFNDSLATIMATRRMTEGKSDVESKSLEEASDALIGVLADAKDIGSTANSKFFNEKTTDFADTTAALNKVVEMPDKFILFDTKTRDQFTKALVKTRELSYKSETYEEAFVKALMESQGIDRAKAMEIVRKLKDCV
ncbi:MAG TPA: hypothetical protein VIG33_11315 [Pseudobdellovibrionaceae bacterium]|jgi:hypothetical protein